MTGEAGALFFQKWLFHYTAKYLMKLNLLEIHNKLPARLQPWFRETREATFQTTLENVGVPHYRSIRFPHSRAALPLVPCTAPDSSPSGPAP